MIPQPVPNFRTDAALAYASRGWRVIPLHWPKIRSTGAVSCSCGKADCGSVGKHPLTANGLKDASADESQVRAWWAGQPAANVGIVTGSASGIVVLDVDLRADGPASLAKLEATHGQLPPTVEVITGGGGAHRFFRHPGGIIIPNSAGKLGAGLDVRGDGGYVVAVPSLHARGERYAWEMYCDPDEAEVAELPKWLLNLMLGRHEQQARAAQVAAPVNRDARKWLGDALAKVSPGTRSEVGHRLACQLRDNRVPRGEAEPIMRDYAARVPAGDHPYTEREALATYASVMKTAARPPAESQNRTYADRPSKPVQPVADPVAVTAPPLPGAADELAEYMTGVIDGRIFNVPFPWDSITQATQALQPGSFCLLGGDPGVGKTFFVLQCLSHWHANGFRPAFFFAEKNRTFYMRRLLAQLSGLGGIVNLDWVKSNPSIARAAFEEHKSHLDELGKFVWQKPRGKLTLDLMLGWIRDRAKDGHRVIVIDPITAVDPGAERWSKESDFVQATQDLMDEFAVSIMLTTHPKQSSGRVGGTSSGHDAAGGAAYFRFVDTMIWLTRSKKPRRCEVNHPIGGTCIVTASNFARLLKTRDSYGANWELAYSFGQKLTFSEHGVVVKDVKDKADELKDVFAPKVQPQQSLDLEDLP
jgi:hypothetical protein